MKIYNAGIILSLICVLPSCRRNYVCVCDVPGTGVTTYTDKVNAPFYTRSALEKACKEHETLSGGNLENCNLK